MNEDIKIALVKYITGQADETESAEVREWIRSSPEHEELYFQYYEAWHNSLASGKTIDAEKAYTAFTARIHPKEVLIKKLSRWTRVAAALVLAASIGLFFYKKQNEVPEPKLELVRVSQGAPRKLTLPDGSLVWLNAGSEIQYSKDFGKKDRTVLLTGEAYFDIAKTNKNIPFLVKTDKYIIRDVGTIFNVKAYPNGKVFETTVVEGKVSVEGPLTRYAALDSKVYLEANQALKITNSLSGSVNSSSTQNSNTSEPVQVTSVNPEGIQEVQAWRDDILIFQGESFEEIGAILQRRYGVEIEFLNEDLKNYRYTGTFKNVDDISTVLDVIKETTRIRYTLAGKKITITTN